MSLLDRCSPLIHAWGYELGVTGWWGREGVGGASDSFAPTQVSDYPVDFSHVIYWLTQEICFPQLILEYSGLDFVQYKVT